MGDRFCDDRMVGMKAVEPGFVVSVCIESRFVVSARRVMESFGANAESARTVIVSFVVVVVSALMTGVVVVESLWSEADESMWGAAVESTRDAVVSALTMGVEAADESTRAETTVSLVAGGACGSAFAATGAAVGSSSSSWPFLRSSSRSSWSVGGTITARMRRLAARPSGVSLGDTDMYSLWPEAVRRRGDML